MKERWKKLLGAEVNTKLLALGAVLLLLAVLAPIARIMMFCTPWYDDFGYGKMTLIFWEAKGTLWAALEGALTNVKSMWHAWQGTYTSCFFMSLMPAVWGTDKYKFGLWFILAMLILGIFCLTRALLTDVLKSKERWNCLVVQAFVAITVVLLMRSAIEGFFWYNSGVHYTAMHGLGMLYIAGLLKLVYAEGRLRTGLLLIGSVIGAWIVGGVNNVTALQVGLVILSILGFGIIFKNKRVWWVLPGAVCYAVALCYNFGAPGNAKRAVELSGMGISPVEAIWRSFLSAFTYLDDFTGWMTVAIMVALVPVIWKIVSKVQFRFCYPGLLLLWSFCLYATGFTPTLYAMGHTLLGRATNMAKVTYQILLFINLVYFLGWLCRYLREKRSVTFHLKSSWCFYLVMGVLMLGIFAAEPNKGGIYSSYCAYYFVHTGEAYNYYHEYLDRVVICESDEADVVVRPYVFKPWLLCLGDLSQDPNYEPNKFMADFYGKNSIICVPPEGTEQE
ncbi:MAG: hypothetical protein IJ335_06685 [Lachnospiraceae bacterium]|nr:hypothetical protein [Lachnospiraceae bacterium]